MKTGLAVPVLNNFRGFTELMHCVGNNEEFFLYVEPNWNENIGVSRSWNNALEWGYKNNLDALVISNDDIVFNQNAFKALVEAFHYKRPPDCMVASINLDSNYNGLEDFHLNANYACFVVDPNQYISSVGWFDTNIIKAYHEDNISEYKIKMLGYKSYTYMQASASHGGSKTQNYDPNNPVVSSQEFEKNREYYISLTGGLPGEERYLFPFNNPKLNWKNYDN